MDNEKINELINKLSGAKDKKVGYFDDITVARYEIENLIRDAYIMGHTKGLNDMKGAIGSTSTY